MSSAPRMRGLGVGDPLLRIAEGEGPQLEGLARLGGVGAVAAIPDPVGERLEAGLAGERSPCSSASACREGRGPRGRRGRRRHVSSARSSGVSFFWRSMASRIDGLARDDAVPALLGRERLLDLDLVEVAGLLLAVAGDEGHGRALAGQLEHGVGAGDPDVGVAGPEPRLERRRVGGHASRLRQRYQLATVRYGRQGRGGAAHPSGFGQGPLPVGPLHGLANAVVVHGQHVEPAQAEHQEHLGGPAADALDPR